MDHITRCPNCSTSFRVTETQLAAFQGKVRCGKCTFVFNARQSLIEPPSAPVTIFTPPEAPEEQPEQEEPTTNTPLTSQKATESAPAQTACHAPDPQKPEESAEDDPTALMQTAEPPPPAPGSATDSIEAGTYRPIVLPEDEALFAPLPRPKHARIWTLATLLAGFSLLLQLAFAYRINLVVEFPALQPRLASLCKKLGCEMPLPRKAEQLRLEWSELTFVPDHPSLVQLSATLRNLAPYDQTLPLLEVTLTDAMERVVARRILQPDEYLTASEKARTSLARGDELHAFLQLDLGNLKSTGYSLYWFYN